MNREEAIDILRSYLMFDKSSMQIDIALNMAIEALKKEAERQEMIIRASEKHLGLVRCKDCRWFKQDSSPVGYGYCDGRMVGREVDYNEYCSFGELADKTKYPATYNTNTKCGGCVHLDELGRCLNFMLAKDDRSCWRGSWENNNGELAEQTDEVHKPDYSYEAEMCKRLSELTEYKLPGHDEVMEALDKLTLDPIRQGTSKSEGPCFDCVHNEVCRYYDHIVGDCDFKETVEDLGARV